MAGARRRISCKGKEDSSESAQVDQKSPTLRKRKSSISQAKPSNKIQKVVEKTPARTSSKSKEVEREKSSHATNKSLKKKNEVKTGDEGMDNEQSFREQFLKMADKLKGKEKEQYLKVRLDKCKKRIARLVKESDAAGNKMKTLSKSLDSMREAMTNLRSFQSDQVKSRKEKEELHRKNAGSKVEEKKKENSLKEQRKIRDVKAQKMDAYNKMRTANNTALLHEASRLKDDNIRLKRIISNVIMNSHYGMATGRL